MRSCIIPGLVSMAAGLGIMWAAYEYLPANFRFPWPPAPPATARRAPVMQTITPPRPAGLVTNGQHIFVD